MVRWLPGNRFRRAGVARSRTVWQTP